MCCTTCRPLRVGLAMTTCCRGRRRRAWTASSSASLRSKTSSLASSTRIGPRTETRCPSWRSCNAGGRAPRHELNSRRRLLRSLAPGSSPLGRMLDAHHIEEVEMSVFESRPVTPPVLRAEFPLLDEAQLAAAAFLARYRGRTLESYRADLRQFFQWANDVGVTPLTATRAHVEL